ncbi:MAG: hypothetical protein DMG55_20500 [Acidobacteria bacterium]|nr:MAG: hypothetical protein DMG55_20500 [Acidobacteriota bacterium]
MGSPVSEGDHRQLVFFPCIVVKGHEAARCTVSFLSLLSKNVSGLNPKGPSFSLILSSSSVLGNPRGFACKAARGHLGYWAGGNEDYLHG